MRGSKFRACLLFALLAFATAANLAGASYWFQSGAMGSNKAEFNKGAGVSIQTVWQNVSDGSFGFWVGESLSNDAFIQAGYQIVNVSGDYPTTCSVSGCDGSTLLTAGKPTWFWEYFTADGGNDQFYGGIGPDGSAGMNGTFNNYSFQSNGNVWTVYFNGQPIGSIDLGASQSGINSPTAIGELADTSINTQTMKRVMFKNLDFYSNEGPKAVPVGYSLISYGKDSSTRLRNLYGVSEVNSQVDYFVVGSGLPLQNQTTLWDIGYSLKVISAYGNVSGTNNYLAYAYATLQVPQAVNLSNGTRAAFAGWIGSGPGSYSGKKANASIEMNGNITETAVWKTQYYVGVNSSYGTSGSGWYDANSTATLHASNIVDFGNGTRVVFAGWSNGVAKNSTVVRVSSPVTLKPLWTTQYKITATTPYGGVQGTGWYNQNSVVTLHLNQTVVPVNSETRLGFYEWSNGYANSTISFLAGSPENISAVFKTQFLVTFEPENISGKVVPNVAYYNVNGINIDNSSSYLFENQSYTVNYLYYKGVKIPLNRQFSVQMPQTVTLQVPLYEVQIRAVSAFGTPVNASLNLTFDNGTRLVSYLGDSGVLNLTNVPYGHVSGYVEYLGIKKDILLSGGTVKILFITPSLIAVTIIAISGAILSGRFVKGRYSEEDE